MWMYVLDSQCVCWVSLLLIYLFLEGSHVHTVASLKRKRQHPGTRTVFLGILPAWQGRQMLSHQHRCLTILGPALPAALRMDDFQETWENDCDSARGAGGGPCVCTVGSCSS